MITSKKTEELLKPTKSSQSSRFPDKNIQEEATERNITLTNIKQHEARKIKNQPIKKDVVGLSSSADKNIKEKIDLEDRAFNKTFSIGYNKCLAEVKKIIAPIINNWYGKRRGTEQRALNEFVQRHVIDTLIEDLLNKLGEMKK